MSPRTRQLRMFLCHNDFFNNQEMQELKLFFLNNIMKSVDMEIIFTCNYVVNFQKISNYNQHSKYYHLEMQFLADQSFFSITNHSKMCI